MQSNVAELKSLYRASVIVRSADTELSVVAYSTAPSGTGGSVRSIRTICEQLVSFRSARASSWPMKPPAPVVRAFIVSIANADVCYGKRASLIISTSGLAPSHPYHFQPIKPRCEYSNL
jgi:hypothetical protein